jgi:hypothetical protein
MKKLSFANKFPKGHAKEGKPTYFLEKINRAEITKTGYVNPIDYGDVELQKYQPKLLTIRRKSLIKGDCYAYYTQNGGRFTPHIDYGSLRISDIATIKIENETVIVDGNEINADAIANLAALDGFDYVQDFFDWHGNTEGYINYWGVDRVVYAISSVHITRHNMFGKTPAQYIPKRAKPLLIDGEWVLLDGRYCTQIIEVFSNNSAMLVDGMIVEVDRLWKDFRFQTHKTT